MAQPFNRYPQIQGLQVIDPGELYASFVAAGLRTDQFWGLANSISCPVGMEPGSAWFVVKRSVANSLSVNSYIDLEWVHENSGSTPTRFNNYVLYRNIAIGLDAGNDAPRLLEFRDKRQVLSLSAIDAEYNVRQTHRFGHSGTTDLFYTDTLNAGSPWTWQGMFEAAWNTLPAAIRGTAPTLAYSPASQPENFRFHGSSWEAIREILDATHSVLCYNPFTDTFTVQRVGATQSGLSSALSALVQSGRLMQPLNAASGLGLANAPQKVRFYFPYRIEDDAQFLVESEAGNYVVDPYYTIDKNTSISGAETGTILHYRTKFIAELDPAENVTNATALNTLADEMVALIAAKINDVADNRDDTYMGIVTSIVPGSEVREMVWRDYGDADGCVTELLTTPRETFLRSEPLTSLIVPRTRVEIVALDGVDKTGDFYEGGLLQWDSNLNTLVSLGSCWILDLNE